MEKYLDFPLSELDTRAMCGDPKAQAYKWIHGYLDNLNDRVVKSYDYEEFGHKLITVGELISTAETHIENDGDYFWGDYISRGGAFESASVDPTFWDMLAILKGIDIPQDKRQNFFSCSC